MDAEEYRQIAANCIRVAQQARTPELKASLVEMAQAWLRLADQAEKNRQADLTYETPPRPGKDPSAQ